MTPPVARTHMLIRRPVEQVFEAFIDPAITCKFWFTRGSARLVQGETVSWHWDMYGFAAEVAVVAVEPLKRIAIAWPTPVEWRFTARPDGTSYVEIEASGFSGTDDEQVAAALDSMGGFCFVLASCKAWLEHGVALNLVRDFMPPGLDLKA